MKGGGGNIRPSIPKPPLQISTAGASSHRCTDLVEAVHQSSTGVTWVRLNGRGGLGQRGGGLRPHGIQKAEEESAQAPEQSWNWAPRGLGGHDSPGWKPAHGRKTRCQCISMSSSRGGVGIRGGEG